MFARRPEAYPLVDIKTKNWRVTIGPCAGRVIERLIAIALIAGALVFFGADIAQEIATLLVGIGA